MVAMQALPYSYHPIFLPYPSRHHLEGKNMGWQEYMIHFSRPRLDLQEQTVFVWVRMPSQELESRTLLDIRVED